MVTAQDEIQVVASKFYRLPQVTQILGVSRSSIWAWVKAGKFPKPVKLSENITVWEVQAIDRWAAERIAASKLGE